MNSSIRNIEILGMRIDCVTSIEVLNRIKQSIEDGERLVIATVNSEFLLRGLDDVKYRDLINSSDLSVADGSGVQWAANFLRRPQRNIILSWGQAIAEGFATLSQRHASRLIPERIPGSLLIWDLASFASKNSYSIYLLGGVGGVAERTAGRLTKRFPTVKIAGYGEGRRAGEEQLQAGRIIASGADIILVAFGSPYQEEWIENTKKSLPKGIFIGVGGTFDFVAGGASRDGGRAARAFPARQTPVFIQRLGLGFLWRLVTQPWRFTRIWRAAPYFMYKVVQYKSSLITH
jgi:N-acetylglucosaminyldiphosphoundecaprenol N-acetyl-beta-D-mannosaminyltransferase